MSVTIILVVLIISVGGVGYLIWKKSPYLKKLAIDNEDAGSYSFWKELAPEVYPYLEKIDLKEQKKTIVEELEKLVRRIHVLSLKIGNFSSSLLDKIKNRRSKNELILTEARMKEENEIVEEISEIIPITRSLDELKKEEQSLIVEIAKSPKDVDLYKKLADIYIEMGNNEDAHEALSAACNLRPDDEELNRNLEKIKKHLSI